MTRLDRRSFLKIGSIAPFGLLSTGDVLRMQPESQKDLAVIHLLLSGGLSHIDSFDPKPDCNPKFRSLFKPIATNVDGIQICEHLPLTAKQADKYVVIRSMTHKVASHEGAMTLMMTGHELIAGVQHPSMGSVISNELGVRSELPAYVAIPSRRRGSRGFPEAFNPSASSHPAFHMAREPEALRDKYGHTDMGQGCLLARRLVEYGVRFVTVNCGNWDHHADIFDNLANDYLPGLDRAYATLLEDLAKRGLLDSTLVLVSGEFGRTPAINAYAGRDHWPHCFSLVIAGGGIAGGRVWGASDQDGMFVRDNPVEVPDFIATLYNKLGIDHARQYVSDAGRSIRLSNGESLKFL